MNRRQKLCQTWNDMKKRCYNPKNHDYCYYGGKGIILSESWLTFENFWNDMNGAYFEGATIDRIDSKGPYSRDNCRWLTRSENTSRAHKGKVVSAQQRRMISEYHKGKSHSAESIERMKLKAQERNSKKNLCVWCNRGFDQGNFVKSHGDRCKLNPSNGWHPHQLLTRDERSTIQKEVARKRLSIVKVCEVCHKQVDVANFAKHHGLRCKFNRGV